MLLTFKTIIIDGWEKPEETQINSSNLKKKQRNTRAVILFKTQ